jgi:hypothetical protein
MAAGRWSKVDEREDRRLHVQLATLLVAHYYRLFPAALANALLGRARQDPLYTRKIR